MQFPSLNDWLAWLEQSHPQEIDLGLDRIRQVAERLQLLNPSAKVVTVAGTNGKGSCVTALAALLRKAGMKTGVFTSPHLLHYCERINVDGTPVSEQDVCEAFEAIHGACEDISLTYFEYGTLAALKIFDKYQVDAMLLEVGLGGRLDAVNIIDADIAVITSIELDHQDWLGNDRESIGYEKAGIIRPSKPMICADPNPPHSVQEMAEKLSAASHFINKDFSFCAGSASWTWQGKGHTQQPLVLADLRLPVLPLPSLAAALQAAGLLGIDVSSLDVSGLLSDLRVPGRFQRLTYRDRQFILDVAHNPAATEYLANRLQREPCSGQTFGIVAMMADKDRSNSLGNLTHVINRWYLADLSFQSRAATCEQLGQDLGQLSVSVAGRGEMVSCIDQVVEATQIDDRIVIFGSFYTVAAALTVLDDAQQQSGRDL